MQYFICEWNTLLPIWAILRKPVLDKQPYWRRVLIALPYHLFPQTTIPQIHGTESSYEGQSCGVLLMVNVNFWQICRTCSLSVFIYSYSYYHYLALDHDSFSVPVKPHCVEYHRNTCLALLFWLHSSRSAIFVYLLPCYSDFPPVQPRGYLKHWGEERGENDQINSFAY